MRLLRNLAVGAAALTFLALPVSALAATLTLDAVNTFHQYQQTTNRPCVIGDHSCTYLTPIAPQPNAIFPDSGGSVDITSAEFLVSTIRALFGGGTNNFWIGFDVNQSSTVQTIDYFAMYINGILVDEYGVIGGPSTIVPPTVGGGNGNGYADYLLRGFTSLAGRLDTDRVTFRAIMPFTNDGKEQFFLIEADAPPCTACDPFLILTPEPTTLLLFGSGLAALAVAMRRRRNA